jgi:hypothetical protein
VIAVGVFDGNAWAGEAKVSLGIFMDERAGGPGQLVTWGKAVQNDVDGFGVRWSWAGQSSKHIPFDWTGPDHA